MVSPSGSGFLFSGIAGVAMQRVVLCLSESFSPSAALCSRNVCAHTVCVPSEDAGCC